MIDYEPSQSVLKWVQRCTEICGCTGQDNERRRKKLRQVNARYLGGLTLGKEASVNREMTIRNLLK